MSSLPPIHSNGLGHGLQGWGANASMSSSQTAVNSYESLDAGLTIQTREGDIVTLSTSQYSELDAYGYSGQGRITQGNTTASAAYNVREITLNSGEVFSFSVQGDLNEQELEDIEAIVAGVDEIISEMSQGDLAEAVSKAMSMDSFDSIAMYAADITVERSYAAYAETQVADVAGRGQALGHDIPSGLEAAPIANEPVQAQDMLAPSFMDQVAKLLEQQKEESLARARQPLSDLFAHHLDALKESAGQADKDAADTTARLSALETAARDIDQMINEMVKDIFENTLNRVG